VTGICGRALAKAEHDQQEVGARFGDLLRQAAVSEAGDAS
jgi:hypothetical protein